MEDKESMTSDYFHVTGLPCPAYASLYDKIIVDSKLKKSLLNYCLLLFRLDGRLTAIYRFILLYGPSGTGKTTLMKGLANRVAKAISSKAGHSVKLFEINVSTFFSEYLGRTSKAVTEAFQTVRMAARRFPVILLLDEIESIGMERTSVGAGDPTDVIRGVNTFITELDRLKQFTNIIVLATSNFSSAIDQAVRNRADLKYYIGNPSKAAAKKILKASVEELGKEIRLKMPASFTKSVINMLYNGQLTTPLSGRDLSRLIVLTVGTKGKNQITVEDVLGVARMLMEERR